MPKQSNINRAYKKGLPHRDARLFIIVAEGEREDKYFEWFHAKNQRIQVQIVSRAGFASAPNHFTKRLEQFLKNADSQPADNDAVWFVLDIDHWERSEIDLLIDICRQNPGYNIAISNPCFELWLNLHTGPMIDNGETCQQLKSILPQRLSGGFKPDHICPLYSNAIIHARNSDLSPAHEYPDRFQTKLYKLGEAMQQVIGNLL